MIMKLKAAFEEEKINGFIHKQFSCLCAVLCLCVRSLSKINEWNEIETHLAKEIDSGVGVSSGWLRFIFQALNLFKCRASLIFKDKEHWV